MSVTHVSQPPQIRVGVLRDMLSNLTVRAIVTSSLWGSRALAYSERAPYHMDNGGDGKLKKYECVEVKHHKDVAKTIEEYESNGWHLYTYQTAGMGTGPLSYIVNHYLLFERDK
jgi:hypothetical protein